MSSYNRIYHNILKGQWAIAPKVAVNHFPLIHKMLTRENFSIEAFEKEDDADQSKRDKYAAVRSYYDRQGRPLDAQVLEGDLPEGTVAVISLDGVMLKWGGLCSYGTEELAQVFALDLQHPRVAGGIIKIDSGGGGVDAIAPFTRVLQSTQKPVVALADMAASAAYYTAIYADLVMADNDISSEFGSIGVMVSFADYQEYYEKQGIKLHTIYAPESTHKNRDFEKALKGEYEDMQQHGLSPLAQKFQAAVRQQRPSLKADVEGILNGRMFYAEEALEHGLIDAIGSLGEALEFINRRSAAQALRRINLQSV